MFIRIQIQSLSDFSWYCSLAPVSTVSIFAVKHLILEGSVDGKGIFDRQQSRDIVEIVSMKSAITCTGRIILDCDWTEVYSIQYRSQCQSELLNVLNKIICLITQRQRKYRYRSMHSNTMKVQEKWHSAKKLHPLKSYNYYTFLVDMSPRHCPTSYANRWKSGRRVCGQFRERTILGILTTKIRFSNANGTTLFSSHAAR